MTKELEQLQYNDAMTDLACAMEHRGTRQFLMDFRDNYPRHFNEIISQIHRLEKRPVAALLRKDEDAPTM
jgi:hypothetical protein